jgi:hypothetical protein
MYCENCRGQRTPCRCGRHDRFLAREHCRDCGYALREIRPGDVGWLKAGSQAWRRDRARYHERTADDIRISATR